MDFLKRLMSNLAGAIQYTQYIIVLVDVNTQIQKSQSPDHEPNPTMEHQNLNDSENLQLKRIKVSQPAKGFKKHHPYSKSVVKICHYCSGNLNCSKFLEQMNGRHSK